MIEYVKNLLRNILKTKRNLQHKHKMHMMISVTTSESVWECTVKDCPYLETEQEDCGTGA